MAAFARVDELKLKFEENPRRYFAPLANELRKLGDFAQAIAICRAHLPAQPGHVSGHIVLAQALQEAGEVDNARGEFEAALELDPENLIALRCIGDIAREHGEIAEARAWYQRVLDADPRNTEIAQIVRDLEGAPNEARVTEASHAELPATPVHNPAVPEETDHRETESVALTSPGASTAPSEPQSEGEKTVSATPSPEQHPVVESVAEVPDNSAPKETGLAEGDVGYFFTAPAELEFSPEEPERAPEHEALDLSDTWTHTQPAAGFGDLEAAPEDWFVGMESAGKPEAGHAISPTPAAPEAPEEDLDDIEALFATEPVPAVAPDLDSAPPATVEPWDSAAEGRAESTADPRDETPRAEPLPSLSDKPEDRELSPAHAELPERSAENISTAGQAPATGDAASSPASPAPAPFVTETLAELYLQQGFRDEALGIYRELLVRNPSDELLQARVVGLEGGQASDAISEKGAPHTPIDGDKASVSVRSLFGRLARRQRTRAAAGGSMTPPASGGGVRAPIPLGARVTTESASSAAVQRGADATGVTSSSADTGSTLTQLFAAKGTDAHDEQAAGSLASAFSVGATTAGRPARAADGELSLDHLFRDRESGQPASVTMDEFYRTDPAREKGEGVDSEKANERTADIRQFTSWLEGLKKK